MNRPDTLVYQVAAGGVWHWPHPDPPRGATGVFSACRMVPMQPDRCQPAHTVRVRRCRQLACQLRYDAADAAHAAPDALDLDALPSTARPARSSPPP